METQIANVFVDNGPAYVIWWLELVLARSLCIFVRQVEPFFQPAGSNILLLVDAIQMLKNGAAEPSVEKLLRSFELPGVSMGLFNWANVALELSRQLTSAKICCQRIASITFGPQTSIAPADRR